MQTFFKTVFILEVCFDFGLCKLPQIQVPKKKPTRFENNHVTFRWRVNTREIREAIDMCFFPFKGG